MIRALRFLLLIFLVPAAAQADSGRASAVPEPSAIVLLAAGVAGLIIGRRGSRSRRRDD